MALLAGAVLLGLAVPRAHAWQEAPAPEPPAGEDSAGESTEDATEDGQPGNQDKPKKQTKPAWDDLSPDEPDKPKPGDRAAGAGKQPGGRAPTGARKPGGPAGAAGGQAGGPPAGPASAEEIAARAAMNAREVAAQKFVETLRAAIAEEIEVQKHERLQFSDEDPETLHGFKQERYERVQSELDFRDRYASQLPRVPLKLPKPGDAARAKLSRQALNFIVGLDKAYNDSRATRPLDQLRGANKAFIETADWAMRDRAVQLRNEIFNREITLKELGDEARALVRGDIGEELLPELEARLRDVAPESVQAGSELAVMVIHDESMREQVLAELRARLNVEREREEMPPPSSELAPAVYALQSDLVEKAGLAEVIAEHDLLESELELLDARLDELLEVKDIPAWRLLAEQWVAKTKRRNELSATWYGTEPDPEVFEDLVVAFDLYIRRQMIDLGPHGTLFAARFDQVLSMEEETTESSGSRWQLLEAQQELAIALAESRPRSDPLEGLEPPPLYGLKLLKKKADAAALAAQIEAGGKPPKVSKLPAKPTPGAKGGSAGGLQKALQGVKKKANSPKGKKAIQAGKKALGGKPR